MTKRKEPSGTKTRAPPTKRKRVFCTHRGGLAYKFYTQINGKVFEGKLPQMPIRWNARLKTTAGRYFGSGNKQIRIEMSSKLLDDERRIFGTLAHEMCHAAVDLIDEIKLPKNKSHTLPFLTWLDKVAEAYPESDTHVSHDYWPRNKYHI